LVQHYKQQAYFCALGLVGEPDVAIDLSQEAFVRAWRSINRLDATRPFFPWYYRILRNLCFNHHRDAKRRARPFSEIGESTVNSIIDPDQDAATDIEKQEMSARLWDAINVLKPHDREVIVLKDFQYLSYKAIAEMLDVPIGTVMSRLYNARQSLKNQLERYWHE
jgi:RNA polymerase sigma-70 factor, ECF subfamily